MKRAEQEFENTHRGRLISDDTWEVYKSTEIYQESFGYYREGFKQRGKLDVEEVKKRLVFGVPNKSGLLTLEAIRKLDE